VRLDPDEIRHEGAESAQRRQEAELPEALPQIQIQLRRPEISRAMLLGELLLEAHAQRAEREQEDDHKQPCFHRAG
jgi:hypothetical protein